jgi:hypothetical protein
MPWSCITSTSRNSASTVTDGSCSACRTPRPLPGRGVCVHAPACCRSGVRRSNWGPLRSVRLRPDRRWRLRR